MEFLRSPTWLIPIAKQGYSSLQNESVSYREPTNRYEPEVWNYEESSRKGTI